MLTLRNLISLAAVVAALLLIALIGDRTLPGWNWGRLDYAFAAALLYGSGLAFLWASGGARQFWFTTAVGLAVLGSFALVWVNLAVGILGSEDNPLNLLFFGVLAVLLAGAALARLQPRAMAFVMLATALAQLLAAVVAAGLAGWQADARLPLVSAFFCLFWLASAAAFWRSPAPSQPAGA